MLVPEGQAHPPFVIVYALLGPACDFSISHLLGYISGLYSKKWSKIMCVNGRAGLVERHFHSLTIVVAAGPQSRGA